MNPPENKTGRTYGEVYSRIITVAKVKKEITALDIPGMSRYQAKQALHNMMLAGYVVLVKSGGMGRHAHPAIYSLSERTV
jgi:hypothetical protein